MIKILEKNFSFSAYISHLLFFMLRNFSRTFKFNYKNQVRAFHDCPANAIQPLRLLLIGCPVSTISSHQVGSSIHIHTIRALEREHSPADWKRTLGSPIYPVVICLEETLQNKQRWGNKRNNTSQMASWSQMTCSSP